MHSLAQFAPLTEAPADRAGADHFPSSHDSGIKREGPEQGRWLNFASTCRASSLFTTRSS